MRYKSVFDIIGPIMIGPSSSHTAGAVQIGRVAREMFGYQPEKIRIQFYGSFAETFRGHATDVAVIGGILDFRANDERIPNAIEIAKDMGIEIEFIKEEEVPRHPNTVKITLTKGEESFTTTGTSVGGGAIQIVEVDGFEIKLTGENPSLLVFHEDQFGTIASVSLVMTKHQLNISHMEVSRKKQGSTALMVIETDQPVPEQVIKEIGVQSNITRLIMLGAA